MIANVSPFINSFDDTYNTLKYADRAKHIKTNIKRNVLNAQYHITNYKNIIKNLQNRVFELENQLSITKKRDFTATPIKLNRNEINDNISQNKKFLSRNSFIGLENKNLRIIKEKEALQISSYHSLLRIYFVLIPQIMSLKRQEYMSPLYKNISQIIKTLYYYYN